MCNVVQYNDDSCEDEDDSQDEHSESHESGSSESQEIDPTKQVKVWKIRDSESSRQARPLFYVDRGRYEKHVFSALTKRGYRQLIHCARSETYRDGGWTKVRKRAQTLPVFLPQFRLTASGPHILTPFFVIFRPKSQVLRLLKLVWLRNRSGFPAQQMIGKLQYWNHIPNEFELTKKNFLAKNLQNYARINAGKIGAEKLQYVLRFFASQATQKCLIFYFGCVRIHPETFFLEDHQQLRAFLDALAAAEAHNANKSKESTKSLPELFIVKPIDSSGGKGISVVDSFATFHSEFLTDKILYEKSPSISCITHIAYVFPTFFLRPVPSSLPMNYDGIL